jgi:hypothetical protein
MFLTAIVSPVVNGTVGDAPHIAAWLLFGASALAVLRSRPGHCQEGKTMPIVHKRP